MPYPLIKLDSNLQKALSTGCVITPRARLARSLKDAHDHLMTEHGLNSWPSSQTMSSDTFFEKTYETLFQMGQYGASKTLLSRDAMRISALSVAPDEKVAKHIELFMSAWQLSHEWNLFRRDDEFLQSENGRTFLHWAHQYQILCHDNGWITAPELPDTLANLTNVKQVFPDRITLVGFDRLSPARNKIFGALADAGSLVVELPLPTAKRVADVSVTTSKSPGHELALAACWARECLATDIDSNIGIIVPTFTQGSLNTIRRQFQAVFPDFENIDDFVNFGGGSRLSHESGCRDALTLLDWAFRPIHQTIIAKLAHSPSLSLNGLAAAIPKLPSFFDLEQYAWHVNEPSAVKAARLVRSQAKVQKPSSWAQVFLDVLRLCGWGEQGVTGRSARLRDNFQSVILELEEQDTLLLHVDAHQALQYLRAVATTRTFTEKTPATRVHVLTRDDSAGLTFDKIWITSLDDTQWPESAKANPFIPMWLQRDLEIPRITQESEFSWAQEMTLGWLRNAKDIIFSFADSDGHTNQSISRILPQVEQTDYKRLLSQPQLADRGHPFMHHREKGVLLDQYSDDNGSAMMATTVTGGISVLRDQSSCPFRGWAIHRLKLRDQREQLDLPNSIERGIIVHEVFGYLFERYRDSKELLSITQESIRDVVHSVLDIYASRIPQSFREQETIRLMSIITDWLEIEAKRHPFKIVAVETSESVTLAGITFNLRIDRRDQSRNGQITIIDFKTGYASPTDWRLPRPRDPQLPAYAIATAAVNSIAVGRIKSGDMSMFGVADDDPHFRTPATFGATDFTTLKNSWQEALTNLAKEYRKGLATVTPQSPQNCRYCHIKPLCRIFETS